MPVTLLGRCISLPLPRLLRRGDTTPTPLLCAVRLCRSYLFHSFGTSVGPSSGFEVHAQPTPSSTYGPQLPLDVSQFLATPLFLTSSSIQSVLLSSSAISRSSRFRVPRYAPFFFDPLFHNSAFCPEALSYIRLLACPAPFSFVIYKISCVGRQV